jgi:hypothetical protein
LIRQFRANCLPGKDALSIGRPFDLISGINGFIKGRNQLASMRVPDLCRTVDNSGL